MGIRIVVFTDPPTTVERPRRGKPRLAGSYLAVAGTIGNLRAAGYQVVEYFALPNGDFATLERIKDMVLFSRSESGEEIAPVALDLREVEALLLSLARRTLWKFFPRML